MRYKFLRFPEGKAKAVTLSYDDGPDQDKKFSDIITKHNIKCTFNLNGDAFKKGNGLSTEQVFKYILDRGHEVAVHGYFHRAEGTMRPIEGIRDILECRIELEKKYGRIIRGMAYPDCGITRFDNNASCDSIKNYLKELDIAYSRTLGGDNKEFNLPTDWYSWMPTLHHKNPEIMEYIDEFLKLDLSEKTYGARRAPRLFYMWGHSYEFDNDDNWDLLETVCEKLANQDDIWYATNIEIYDYVTAYNSLVYSADGKTIYNPTLHDIWFDIDTVCYCIKSGQTIKI